MTVGAQAVYDELNSRKGVLDGIDQDIVEEMCEAVYEAVRSVLQDA